MHFNDLSHMRVVEDAMEGKIGVGICGVVGGSRGFTRGVPPRNREAVFVARDCRGPVSSISPLTGSSVDDVESPVAIGSASDVVTWLDGKYQGSLVFQPQLSQGVFPMREGSRGFTQGDRDIKPRANVGPLAIMIQHRFIHLSTTMPLHGEIAMLVPPVTLVGCYTNVSMLGDGGGGLSIVECTVGVGAHGRPCGIQPTESAGPSP